MEQRKPLREESRKADSRKLEVNLADPIIRWSRYLILLLVSLGQLILGVNCHAGEAAKALWWDDDQGDKDEDQQKVILRTSVLTTYIPT